MLLTRQQQQQQYSYITQQYNFTSFVVNNLHHQVSKNNTQFMAGKSSPSKEVSLDLTRELLIAISESSPEQLLNSKFDKEPVNGASVTGADKVEELRSELISISYVPAPEKIALPANGHL